MQHSMLEQPLVTEMAYWIMERYAIKERRAAGMEKPWSADPVFQRVRFCNVHREDDAVTRWIRTNWNKPTDQAWKFVLGRLINLPESLADILDVVDIKSLSECNRQLILRRELGGKIFTSAYTISTCGRAMDKLDYVFGVVDDVRRLEESYALNYDTCALLANDLIDVDGLGSFLSAQIVADMKNTVGHPLSNAPDFWTFSLPGPGSLRGLSWFFYGKSDCVTRTRYGYLLTKCREIVDPLVMGMTRISDQDFQNCLCEFSKYMRATKDPSVRARNSFQGA